MESSTCFIKNIEFDIFTVIAPYLTLDEIIPIMTLINKQMYIFVHRENEVLWKALFLREFSRVEYPDHIKD